MRAFVGVMTTVALLTVGCSSDDGPAEWPPVSIVVVSELIPRGTSGAEVADRYVTIEERPRADVPDARITSTDEFVGMEALFDIPAGVVLTVGMFVTEPIPNPSCLLITVVDIAEGSPWTGEQVISADTYFADELTDRENQPDAYLACFNGPVGTFATRDIPAGSLLTVDMFLPPPEA